MSAPARSRAQGDPRRHRKMPNSRTTGKRAAPGVRRHNISNIVIKVNGNKAMARAYWFHYSNNNPERQVRVQRLRPLRGRHEGERPVVLHQAADLQRGSRRSGRTRVVTRPGSVDTPEETFTSGVRIVEPGAEVVFAEAGGASEGSDPRRVAEVARSETHHARRATSIALGRHVHSTTPARAARIERIRKRIGVNSPP